MDQVTGIGGLFFETWEPRLPPTARLQVMRHSSSRPTSRASFQAMGSTRISRHVKAPRALVYRALLDPRAIATWMVPTGVTSQVHAFDAREGGSFRISLADAADGTDVLAVHDGLPPGLLTADNETGWQSSPAKLAAFVESGAEGARRR